MFTNTNSVPRGDLMIALKEFDSEKAMIATEVLPTFPVDKISGQYPVIPPESLMQYVKTAAADTVNTPLIDIKANWDNYTCKKDHLGSPISKEDRLRYGDWFDADEMAAEVVNTAMQISLEKEVADLVTNTSVLPNGSAGTAWSTIASAAPMTNAANAIAAIKAATGVVPNAAIMSWTTRRNLGRCAQILDAMKYSENTAKQDLSDSAIAEALGVPRLIVGDRPYVNSAEGAATTTIANIWPNDKVIFAKLSEGTNPKSPQFAGLGRLLFWSQYQGELMAADSWHDPDAERDIVRLTRFLVAKLFNAKYAYVLTGTA